MFIEKHKKTKRVKRINSQPGVFVQIFFSVKVQRKNKLHMVKINRFCRKEHNQILHAHPEVLELGFKNCHFLASSYNRSFVPKSVFLSGCEQEGHEWQINHIAGARCGHKHVPGAPFVTSLCACFQNFVFIQFSFIFFLS